MPNAVEFPSVLTRAQVRAVDRVAIDEFGITGAVLMENAGRNAAELLQSLRIAGRVVICCGKGNNAGDGFVIARHLENAGVDVRVLLSMPPAALAGDAATNFQVLVQAGTSFAPPLEDWTRELAAADWIVDALLGTGTEGTVREPFASRVAAINAAERNVLAIDIPSGLDCDTGQPLGCCVRAGNTATYVARKPGFDAPGAGHWTGKVHVLDIGVPKALFRRIE
jgi:NAD(P)H-hydrate epimerase